MLCICILVFFSILCVIVFLIVLFGLMKFVSVEQVFLGKCGWWFSSSVFLCLISMMVIGLMCGKCWVLQFFFFVLMQLCCQFFLVSIVVLLQWVQNWWCVCQLIRLCVLLQVVRFVGLSVVIVCCKCGLGGVMLFVVGIGVKQLCVLGFWLLRLRNISFVLVLVLVSVFQVSVLLVDIIGLSLLSSSRCVLLFISVCRWVGFEWIGLVWLSIVLVKVMGLFILVVVLVFVYWFEVFVGIW